MRTAIQGREAAKYRTGKDEYDIVVRLAEPFRSDLPVTYSIVDDFALWFGRTFTRAEPDREGVPAIEPREPAEELEPVAVS